MSPDPDLLLARLREIALALPETYEKQSYGSPGFFIQKGKAFAYFWHDHHGDSETVAIVKTSGCDEQTTLIEQDPEVYYAPPYMGPSGWIAIRLDRDTVDWDHIGDRVAMSWEMVAPRRLLEMGGR